MGPTIILDKSALQSLSQKSVRELSRYFFTNITPVLLHEILADLQLKRLDLDDAKLKVAEIANKVIPINAVSNAHYTLICLNDLLGDRIVMDGRPVIGNAEAISTPDGRKGFYVPVQPENEALLRWRRGDFTQSDLDFAVDWREVIRLTDLDGLKRSVATPSQKATTLLELRTLVDRYLSDPAIQDGLLPMALDVLGVPNDYYNQIAHRWSISDRKKLSTFAP